MNSALANGSGNQLTITGTTAGFTIDLPVNVGVGDIIVYDSNNDGILNARAFIESRSAGSVFIVQNAMGAAPASTTFPDEDWEIYRAYTSLYEAEQGLENIGIPVTLRNFDNAADGWDLILGDQTLQLACYADGVDNTPVVFSGSAWTTDPTHFVRVFTPIESTNVGMSQRHDGKWHPSAYRMVTTDATCLYIQVDYFRVEGLQFNISTVSGISRKCINVDPPGVSEIYISQSIFFGTVTDQDTHAGITLFNAGSGLLFIWNNVFYNFNRSGTNFVAGIDIDDPEFVVHILNNTLVECYYGIFQNMGSVYVINNLTQNCVDGFFGAFDPSSDYNLSDLVSDAPGPNSLNSSLVTFANYAGRDLHLDPSDMVAKDNGTDLSGYGPLSFTNDIDDEIRTMSWDIGCDEEYPIPTPTPTLTPSVTQTMSPTLSPTVTVSATPTASPTVSPTGTVSSSPTVSPTPSPTPSVSASPTPSPTLSETFTPTVSETVTPTMEGTPTYTSTVTVTSTVTATLTETPDYSATVTPSVTQTPQATRTFTPEPEPEITTVRIRNNVIKSGGNQGVSIDIPLENAQQVIVKIYNQRGNLISTVSDQEQAAGIFQAVWEGKHQNGELVRSGVYLIYIKTDHVHLKKKVAVIR